MHILAVILAVVAAIGITTSTIFLVLTIAGACVFFREAAKQKRFAASLTDDQLPFVSLLKPMHGIEPQLEENFERFLPATTRTIRPSPLPIACASAIRRSPRRSS